MIRVKILFVNDAPFEDREEVFPTTNQNEAILMAADKLSIEESKYLFSFDFKELDEERKVSELR